MKLLLKDSLYEKRPFTRKYNKRQRTKRSRSRSHDSYSALVGWFICRVSCAWEDHKCILQNPHATLTQNSVRLFGDMDTFATNASLTAGPTSSLETARLLRYPCSARWSALGGTTRLTLAVMVPLNLTLGEHCNLTLNPNLRPEALPFFPDGR